MMSHWPSSFLVKLHHFSSWINSVVCFVMYNFVLWMSILTYVFAWVNVMHIFVRMTIHILMGFRHVHLCTNDYPYYSCMCFRHVHLCTNDYPFPCVWVFVMHIFLRTTMHSLVYGFSSCTFLYEWLSISLCVGFRHAHFCTNEYHFFLK